MTDGAKKALIVGAAMLAGLFVGYRAVNAVSGVGARIVALARSQSGVPYSWGGGSLTGPSSGSGTGAATVGFDCSGLTRYAVRLATGRTIPRMARDQYTSSLGSSVAPAQVRAGDLLFFDTSGKGVPTHVGIADGAGGMIHAPHTGTTVQRTSSVLAHGYWPKLFLGARRFA